MKSVTLVIILLLELMLFGCLQEIKGCVSDCAQVCSFVKEGNLSSNYTSITLAKKSDGATISCTCSCE